MLLNFQLALLAPGVAERAVIIRRGSRIKLPDAIIMATAESEGRVLITRNTRDLPASTRGIHIPYTI
jgi:predicted nucleic acid-binding protein